MVNDTIANMITCIRNANLSKIKYTQIRATRVTRSIANILLQEGYIESIRERQEDTQSLLVINLRSNKRRSKKAITTIRRISKPGLRVYSNYQEIPKVLGGIGIVILSTSKGIITDREARQYKIGGEILCYVW